MLGRVMLLVLKRGITKLKVAARTALQNVDFAVLPYPECDLRHF
jgi:hypothetical protein